MNGTAGTSSANGTQSTIETFETSDLYNAVYKYVEEYMSRYDASHDFNHILRVLALAKHILAQEIVANSSRTYDTHAIVLAALLHDVGDKKYLKAGENAEAVILSLLNQNACPSELSAKVALIVEHVSYSSEIKRPQIVREVMQSTPELAIVQDADRLDAIGAVGIGRVFAFGAVKAPDRGMQGSIDHFADKLERLESMMKTNTGRRIARKRTQRLVDFKEWWSEECTLLS